MPMPAETFSLEKCNDTLVSQGSWIPWTSYTDRKLTLLSSWDYTIISKVFLETDIENNDRVGRKVFAMGTSPPTQNGVVLVLLLFMVAPILMEQKNNWGQQMAT